MAAAPARIATGRRFSLGSVCGEGSGSGLSLLPGLLARALVVNQKALLQPSVPSLVLALCRGSEAIAPAPSTPRHRAIPTEKLPLLHLSHLLQEKKPHSLVLSPIPHTVIDGGLGKGQRICIF